jgi:hypothetical protein
MCQTRRILRLFSHQIKEETTNQGREREGGEIED